MDKKKALLFLLTALCAAGLCASENVGDTLIHHVSDSSSWRLLPFLPELHLPTFTIAGVTVKITKHTIMVLLGAVMLAVVFIPAFGQVRMVPNTLGSILEPVVLFVRDGIVFPVMGEKKGAVWLPFFLTMFFFILASNVLGMIPLFPTITANLSVTLALALITLVCVLGYGFIKKGPIGFFLNLVPHGIPKVIGFFLFFIEVSGLVIRNGVLAIRLFANMLAGHFVILALLLLIFLLHPAASLIAVPMALFITLLEVLVAFIQALVFTLLSTIFISAAVESH